MVQTYFMRLLFTVFCSLFAHLSFSQNDTTLVIDENVFQKVEVDASVDPVAWRQHLEARLGAVIEKAAKKGMKPGRYTVNVRFLVEKDGSISDVKALNDPGFGLAKAAEKVVKTGPRWKPARQNGRAVRSYHTQPISFVITEA